MKSPTLKMQTRTVLNTGRIELKRMLSRRRVARKEHDWRVSRGQRGI